MKCDLCNTLDTALLFSKIDKLLNKQNILKLIITCYEGILKIDSTPLILMGTNIFLVIQSKRFSRIANCIYETRSYNLPLN